MKVLALVTDLMFASRIAAEAKAAGTPVQILRKPEQLSAADGELLLADLNLDGAAAAAAKWAGGEGRRVVGFVSHMDSAAIAAAREAGVQEIMASSRFVQILPDLLRP
jgi:hypothetical protein